MIILILYLFIAIFFSFLCSMLEAIILSTTPTFIEIKLEEKKNYAPRLKHLKENIDKPLAAILTLNTFAHTIGAAGVGAQAQAIWGNEYLSIVSIVLTLLILFVSEIIPKTLGATYWKQLIPIATHTLNILIIILYPFVIVSQYFTKLISNKKAVKTFSRSEFSALAKLGAKFGIFNREESNVLESIADLNKIAAKDILTPRTVVVSASEDLTAEEFYKEKELLNFTRIPIYKDNPDNITGFILKDEVLTSIIEGGHDKKLSEFKREIEAIFENYPVHKLYSGMITNSEQIVLIIDEHGGMEGIVTLEDVLETLIGFEIVDETDVYKDMRVLAKETLRQKTRKD